MAPWDRPCDEPDCSRTATTRSFGTGITRETCNGHIPREARATFCLDD